MRRSENQRQNVTSRSWLKLSSLSLKREVVFSLRLTASSVEWILTEGSQLMRSRRVPPEKPLPRNIISLRY